MKKADIETVFQSTLPVGEATSVREDASHADAISIHASREGSDRTADSSLQEGRYFNPRFPRGKRRRPSVNVRPGGRFQSTLPAREATTLSLRILIVLTFQSTLPVGEATFRQGPHGADPGFQSTLPVGEATLYGHNPAGKREFQSTLPVGEATPLFTILYSCVLISIHASRGGSDGAGEATSLNLSNFNPRFPWGKRPHYAAYKRFWEQFQSTLPVGEATIRNVFLHADDLISIHASRGGSDFNANPFIINLIGISIHASRGGSDPGNPGIN